MEYDVIAEHVFHEFGGSYGVDGRSQIGALVLCGSRLYGLHRDGSDYDIRGWFFPLESDVFGFRRTNMFSAQIPVTIGSVTRWIDVVLYSMPMFVRMLLCGSPQAIEIIAIPSKYVVYSSSYFQEMQGFAGLFTRRPYINSVLHLSGAYVNRMKTRKRYSVQQREDILSGQYMLRLLYFAHTILKGDIFIPIIPVRVRQALFQVPHYDCELDPIVDEVVRLRTNVRVLLAQQSSDMNLSPKHKGVFTDWTARTMKKFFGIGRAATTENVSCHCHTSSRALILGSAQH